MQIAEEKGKNKIKNVGSANKRRAGLFTAIGEGSAATKASAVFMGSGQIARGQIIKGIFYLAAETAFVLFMIFFRESDNEITAIKVDDRDIALTQGEVK